MDGVAIIDSIIDWDTQNQLRRATREANAALSESKRPNKCGKCHWWMKSRDCPKERNVKGYSRGPSCNDSTAVSCPKFKFSDNAIYFMELLEKEAVQTANAKSFADLPKR